MGNYKPDIITSDTIWTATIFLAAAVTLTFMSIFFAMGYGEHHHRTMLRHHEYSLVLATIHDNSKTVILANGDIGVPVSYTLRSGTYTNLYDSGSQQILPNGATIETYANNSTGKLLDGGTGSINYKYNSDYAITGVFGGAALGLAVGTAVFWFLYFLNWAALKYDDRRHKKTLVATP